VKKIDNVHSHFVSCIRWAPSVVNEPATNGDGQGDAIGAAKAVAPPDAKIRCVIATGSVDLTVRIFAN
jgi:platelet-activating factor acetylhydrolase IB subunit alpha